MSEIAEHILLREAAARVREQDPRPKPPSRGGKTTCRAANPPRWCNVGSRREAKVSSVIVSNRRAGEDIEE